MNTHDAGACPWQGTSPTGSGSTLIAADTTGRVCRGVELDPLYVNVIVRRYEAAQATQRSD